MNIDKEKKDLIEKILREIAEDIIERFDKKELEKDIGLLSGKTGISLFMFYNSKYLKCEKYKKYAQLILEDVFNDINEGCLFPTYCSGIAGVSWAIIHLVEQGFIEKENLIVLKEFDEYLNKAMRGYISRCDFDFLHGATGIAYYFTRRKCYNTEVNKFLKYYKDNIENYALHVEDKNISKILMNITTKEERRSNVYNLSMSHGVSSVIIILTEIFKVFKNEKMISDNILNFCYGLCNYIINCKNKNLPFNNALYPSYMDINDNIHKNIRASRLSWCYGDLGNAFALYNTYIIDKNASLSMKYLEESKIIFDNLRNRKELDSQMIYDAGVCHGASGILLMLNVAKKKFIIQESLANELLLYWLNVVIKMYLNINSIKGFYKFYDGQFIYDNSILGGTTSVGISLLNCIDNQSSSLREIYLL